MPDTTSFARQFAARLGSAFGASAVSYVCWREFYLRVLHPKPKEESCKQGRCYHACRLTTSYYLGLPAYQGFLLLADPTLLNQTTPVWFDIRVRPKSKDTMREFCHYLKLVDFDRLSECAGRSMECPNEGKKVADLANEQEFLRRFPFFFTYWVCFFGAPFPWTSKVLVCQKVWNPEPTNQHLSIPSNISAVQQADQRLMDEVYTTGRRDELDENVVVRPMLGTESYKFFFRMKYAEEQGPYSRFEHTHLVICDQAGNDAGYTAQLEAKADSEVPHEHCRVEDTIVFSVLGEPILDYIAGVFLKRILRHRCASMNGIFIDERVFDVS